MASKDSYEAREKRIQDLFNEASTPESSQDPYADDDGDFGSDQNYEPSGNEYSSSEEDEIRASQTRRAQQRNTLPSGESDYLSSENDSTTSEFEESRENDRHILLTQPLAVHELGESSSPVSNVPIAQAYGFEDLMVTSQLLISRESNTDEYPGNPQEISSQPTSNHERATSPNEPQEATSQPRLEIPVIDDIM